MTLIKKGSYLAKVSDHGITHTKSGDPQASVRFRFNADDGERELTWFGSFKDTVVEHTIKGLVACGLKGNNPAGPLEIGKEVSIVVDIDTNSQGQPRNIVRWVNALGGGLKKIDPGLAAQQLERFSGAVAAYKSKEGIAPRNHATGADEAPPWD